VTEQNNVYQQMTLSASKYLSGGNSSPSLTLKWYKSARIEEHFVIKE
jgi:hypothetical protein